MRMDVEDILTEAGPNNASEKTDKAISRFNNKNPTPAKIGSNSEPKEDDFEDFLRSQAVARQPKITPSTNSKNVVSDQGDFVATLDAEKLDMQSKSNNKTGAALDDIMAMSARLQNIKVERGPKPRQPQINISQLNDEELEALLDEDNPAVNHLDLLELELETTNKGGLLSVRPSSAERDILDVLAEDDLF